MWIVTEDNFFQAFELDIVDDDEENGFFDLFVGTYPRQHRCANFHPLHDLIGNLFGLLGDYEGHFPLIK